VPAARSLAVACAILALLRAGAAGAIELQVVNAWIRSASQGQASTPAYMDIHSDTALKLVGASSPWAATIEIRATEKAPLGVDRAMPALDVAPGETRLAPGGNYVALTGIKRGFGNGDLVPITLRFEDAAKIPHTVDVTAEARGMTAPAPRGQP